MAVYKIFTEPKNDYKVRADKLKSEIKNLLKITSVTNVRIITRFLAEGISEEHFQKSKYTVYASPFTHNIYEEAPDFKGARYFYMQSLPGQFDSGSNAVAFHLALLSLKDNIVVNRAEIYVFEGNITEEQLAVIKKFIVNPVECRIIPDEIPATIIPEYPKAEPVKTADGFIDLDDSGLESMLTQSSMAMDINDLKLCRDYFKSENRNPTVTELKLIDTYWSDHCRHTTFLTHIKEIEILDENIENSFKRYLKYREELGREDKPITLMDLATVAARVLKKREVLTDLDESEEINACSVNIKVDVNGKDEDWLLMFKNETHNHPTEIEPFGGASTCLGGCIRDPLSGRSFVYQAMRITGVSDPREDYYDTIPGKLSQYKLCTTAADGYSEYANQIGLASGYLDEVYHEGFKAKRMELGALVGAVKKENVVRETPAEGDVVILLGGKTGRDGCGGATGSSKAQDESSFETCGAEVQKGYPLEERKIVRLYRNPEASRLIIRCNDFGAGGVSVSIGELADGLNIDLDKVITKYDGLDGTELAISESQERMSVVVHKKDAPKFISLAEEEGLSAVIVAEVTANMRLKMTWRGDTIVDLSREFLNSNGAVKYSSVKIEKGAQHSKKIPRSTEKELETMLSDVNFLSKKDLASQFDFLAGAGTVLAPFGGKYQETRIQAMAAKIPVDSGDTRTVSLMAHGYEPKISEKSPYYGSVFAVVHSVAKIIAAGGRREKCWLSFQEYFESLRGEAVRWGKPFSALLGSVDAQMGLECASIGGKDSMSGTYLDIDVPPTLVSFAVSVTKENRIISPEFKKAGSFVYLLSSNFDLYGAHDYESLKSCFDKLEALISNGKVKSAYAIGFGGALDAVFNMSLGNKIGLKCVGSLSSVPMPGAFVIEADEIPELKGCLLGRTSEEFEINTPGESIDLNRYYSAYRDGLKSVYGSGQKNTSAVSNKIYKSTNTINNSLSRKPVFFIPVFPGATGEYELAEAVKAAGADVSMMIVKNQTAKDVTESIDEFIDKVRMCNAIVMPGGSVLGDEPQNGGIYSAIFLAIPEVKAAVLDLYENREGLIIGFGSAFASLTATGLLPYGRFTAPDEVKCALGLNLTGKHFAGLADVKVVSDNSPLVMTNELEGIFKLPLSIKYGSFTASEELIRELEENGQVILRYAGAVNTSASYIDAVSSKDGRIYGQISLPYLVKDGLYKNIPGVHGIDIFKNAVEYFR